MGEMLPFSVMDLTEPEPERKVQYVNMDARFLLDLADEMDDGEEPDETTLRLRMVAAHLESMDERLRNLLANDKEGLYAAGIAEGKRRILARSNLPVQSVEIRGDKLLRDAIARSTVPVRRIERERKPEKANLLAGITLDLSLLDKED